MRKKATGRLHTEETKKKMSEIKREYWNKRKNMNTINNYQTEFFWNNLIHHSDQKQCEFMEKHGVRFGAIITTKRQSSIGKRKNRVDFFVRLNTYEQRIEFCQKKGKIEKCYCSSSISRLNAFLIFCAWSKAFPSQKKGVAF